MSRVARGSSGQTLTAYNAPASWTDSSGLLSPAMGTLTSLTGGAVGPAVQPLLSDVLTDVADPALQDLGVGIGEMDLTVSAAVIPAANAAFKIAQDVIAVGDRIDSGEPGK